MCCARWVTECKCSGYRKGDILFNEGDLADGLYLVVNGRVSIGSGAVEIRERTEGEYVGELALIDDSPPQCHGPCEN